VAHGENEASTGHAAEVAKLRKLAAELRRQLRRSREEDSPQARNAKLAHDLNNLIMIIRGNADLLRLASKDDPKFCRMIDQIILASDRACGLTEGLVGGSVIREEGESTDPRRTRQAPARAEGPREDSARAAKAGGRGRILLVDDDEAVRSFAGKALGGMGYVVHVCTDGVDAVEYYREHHHEVDLVILDLIMPRLDGAGAFRQFKLIDPNVRVLLCSGFSHGAAAELLHSGALGFLSKPFRLEELSRQVARFVAAGANEHRPAREGERAGG
jgi:CheY-like chemotaxis protein